MKTTIPGIPCGMVDSADTLIRMKEDRKALNDLYVLLCTPRTPREAKLLAADLLTPRELQSLAERWHLIRMLAAGVPQREVKKKLNISISKITRGSRMLKHGSGGFRHALKYLGKKTVI